MSKFLAFIKLIRFKNLLIVALIQLLIKYALINIYLETFALNNSLFGIYLIALVLVVAGGYIINDIYDVETDKINKEEKRIIGKEISTSAAFKGYYLLNILGIISGFYVAFEIGKITFGIIFIFFSFSLWRYSKQYKTSFLIGNLQVAFLTAFSIFNLALFDLVPIGNSEAGFKMIFQIILFYSAFSFTTTLVRELIKDVEDMEGDKKTNAKTAAITFGLQKSKWIAMILILITIFGIGCFQYFQYSVVNSTFDVELMFWGADTTAIFYTAFIQLFLFFLIFKTQKAETKNDFHILSSVIKIIMLFGILSIPLFTFSHTV